MKIRYSFPGFAAAVFIFSALAPGIGDISRTPGREKLDGTAEQGYLHAGPNGGGHGCG